MEKEKTHSTKPKWVLTLPLGQKPDLVCL